MAVVPRPSQSSSHSVRWRSRLSLVKFTLDLLVLEAHSQWHWPVTPNSALQVPSPLELDSNFGFWPLEQERVFDLAGDETCWEPVWTDPPAFIHNHWTTGTFLLLHHQSETDRTGGVYLKDLSGLYCPRTMGSLWGSVMLLCGVVLLRTEGSRAQQTKNNVPRLKLSYKGQFFAFVHSVINVYMYDLEPMS